MMDSADCPRSAELTLSRQVRIFSTSKRNIRSLVGFVISSYQPIEIHAITVYYALTFFLIVH